MTQGKIIEDYQEEQGLSNADLASLLHISPSFLWYLKMDKRRAGNKVLDNAKLYAPELYERLVNPC